MTIGIVAFNPVTEPENLAHTQKIAQPLFDLFALQFRIHHDLVDQIHPEFLLVAQQVQDGRVRHAWPYAPVLLLIPVAVSWSLGVSWAVTMPELRGFNFVGGWTLSPEYFSLLIALVTYTSAFIAEIVRSGIQAVSRGQWDAALALGLRRSFVLRQIVLPQALRVIIPPMTSQYLNLTKNSSLAVAIGYQDIVSIANTTLNQTGQAIDAIALIMLVFLTISLSISLFMNWYNAHIALVER